jgi:GxxExxY protein
MSLTHAQSTLGPDLEELAESTIGICLTVHRELGPGMNEAVYSRACRIELAASEISFESEKPVPIRYRGRLLTTQRVDLVVAEKLIVEIKSVERLHPVHIAQAVSYLRATGLRIALVVNFNVSVLRQGIRRVVL